MKQILIIETYLNEFKLKKFQNRLKFIFDQGFYLAAIEEFKKSIAKGNKNNIDIAYCYLQLDELKEAELFVNAYSESEQNDILAQLIKAELLLRTQKEKEGAQVLFTAYQYYKSKQFNITDYTPKELEYLEQKLNDRNGSYIESFYKKTRTNKLDYDSKNTFLLFVKELNNKQQLIQNKIFQIFIKIKINKSYKQQRCK